MKIVLEIKLPVGVRELGAISNVLDAIHAGKNLLMRQEGPMLQIFYDQTEWEKFQGCLPTPTSGQ